MPKIRTSEIYWHNHEKPSVILAEEPFGHREKTWLQSSPLYHISFKTLKVLFPVLFLANCVVHVKRINCGMCIYWLLHRKGFKSLHPSTEKYLVKPRAMKCVVIGYFTKKALNVCTLKLRNTLLYFPHIIFKGRITYRNL